MSPATDATPGLPLPVIDIHTHLAGLGQGGTDCFIAPHKFHSLLYKLMRWKLGIYNAHKEEGLDPAYLDRLQRDVTAAAEHKSLHAAVIFAHDRIYTESGELHPAAQELYVPNEYAFRCAESLPGRFLPATSVHPYRTGALEEIEKWIERGAVALKWLPNSQCMDPRDARCFPIYDLLVRKNIPMIVHTGGEHRHGAAQGPRRSGNPAACAGSWRQRRHGALRNQERHLRYAMDAAIQRTGAQISQLLG
jgi:hypothetical protein